MTLPGFPPASGDQPPNPGQPYAQREVPNQSSKPAAEPPFAQRKEPDDSPVPAAAAPHHAEYPSDTPAKLSVTRVAARRTKEVTRSAVTRITTASNADGAGKSGLSTLLWSNALSMGGDALIAVWLATSLFFAAPGEQQRGNVALYLLVTVAPFAVIAPIIGPLLDRIDRGRRWALAGTFATRAFLCYLLVAYAGSTVMLYVSALLCLVFSRSYNVLRGAVIPRVLPPDMVLVHANSRMNTFGIASAGILGAVGAGLIKFFDLFSAAAPATDGGPTNATLGFAAELIFTLLVFLAGAWVALKLPSHVDTDKGEGKVNITQRDGKSKGRLTLGTHIITALRATSAQKFLGGFLTFFMVFYIQDTMKGFGALATLGALGVAAGAGSFIGTSIGARVKGSSPDNLVLITTGIAVGFCVLAAITPSIGLSIAVALVAAIASGLGKLAVDAIIQREVPATFASSAFSRSETVQQLAWVAGGAAGIVLPARAGLLWLGWTVAAIVLVVAFSFALFSQHRAKQYGHQQAGIVDEPPMHRRLRLAARAKSITSRMPTNGTRRTSRNPVRSGRASTDRATSNQQSPGRHQRSNRADPQPWSAPADQWLSTPIPGAPTTPLPDFRQTPPPPSEGRQ